MGQKISFTIPSKDAKNLWQMGREFYGDPSLGMAQSCAVLLLAISSGDYKLAKARKKKEEPEQEESE